MDAGKAYSREMALLRRRFAVTLRGRREDKFRSQETFAEHAHLHRTTIGGFGAGQDRPASVDAADRGRRLGSVDRRAGQRSARPARAKTRATRLQEKRSSQAAPQLILPPPQQHVASAHSPRAAPITRGRSTSGRPARRARRGPRARRARATRTGSGSPNPTSGSPAGAPRRARATHRSGAGASASSSAATCSRLLAEQPAEALELLRRELSARCARHGAAGTRAAPAAHRRLRARRRRRRPALDSAHVERRGGRALERAGGVQRVKPRPDVPRGRRARAQLQVLEDRPHGHRRPWLGLMARGALERRKHQLVGHAGAARGARAWIWVSTSRLLSWERPGARASTPADARGTRHAALRDNRRASRVSNSVPGPGC